MDFNNMGLIDWAILIGALHLTPIPYIFYKGLGLIGNDK